MFVLARYTARLFLVLIVSLVSPSVCYVCICGADISSLYSDSKLKFTPAFTPAPPIIPLFLSGSKSPAILPGGHEECQRCDE